MYEKLYSEKLYKIVFDGEIMEGYIVDEVKKKLSGIFKWDQGKVDELFSVIPLEIADKIDYQTAMTYKAPFERAGAICKIYHSEKALLMENDSLSSSLLNKFPEVDVHLKMIYPQYDFGQPEAPESINGGVFNKKYPSHLETQEEDEKKQSRQMEIKTNLCPNVSSQVESKELLNREKDTLYQYFSSIYRQAKEKTACKKFKLIIYALIGLSFLFSFIIPMIAAMRGLYAIGIAGGFLMALLSGIIKYPMNAKINKNRLLKTALYFKQLISVENQKNLSFFLAALILWSQKISYLDPAKDEMLSVCNEIALINAMDIEILKKYLKKIGDLDKQAKCELYELYNNKNKEYISQRDYELIGL